MLQQNREPNAGLVTTHPLAEFDGPVFEAIWSPCVSALCYVFDTAIDEAIVTKTIQALHTCTHVAAKFNNHEAS